MAQERELDLIEVAPNATPPVCRLMNYGKFKYEQQKREREAQKKAAASELKGVRIRPGTGEHDLLTKTRMAQRFLEEGHKVKVTCMFRGREMAHREIGESQLQWMAEHLQAVSRIEGPVTQQGRLMMMMLSPHKAAVGKVKARPGGEGQPAA